jgi:hypothetical protein
LPFFPAQGGSIQDVAGQGPPETPRFHLAANDAPGIILATPGTVCQDTRRLRRDIDKGTVYDLAPAGISAVEVARRVVSPPNPRA